MTDYTKEQYLMEVLQGKIKKIACPVDGKLTFRMPTYTEVCNRKQMVVDLKKQIEEKFWSKI